MILSCYLLSFWCCWKSALIETQRNSLTSSISLTAIVVLINNIVPQNQGVCSWMEEMRYLDYR